MNRLDRSICKILFVCDAFWPYGIGGAEEQARIILSQLAKKDAKVLVLTHRFSGTKPQETLNNLIIYRESLFLGRTLGFPQRLFSFLKTTLVIQKYILTHRPDVIITQQLISTSAVLVSKIFKIPVIVVVHDYWPICCNRSLIKPNTQICTSYDRCFRDMYTCAKNSFNFSPKGPKLAVFLLAAFYSILMYFQTYFVRNLIRNADRVIAVSHFLKKTLIINGFSSRKILVIYNPIMMKNQIKAQAADSPYILFVGRLIFEKGVDVLLKAMQQVRMKESNATLLVVGRGPQKKNLESLANSLKIEQHVKFLDSVSNEQLINLYKRSSVVVMPSIWPEAFGRVIVEAMMYNRPVIASDIGAIPELVDKGAGLLVPPGEPNALATAIISVIDNTVQLDHKRINCQKFSPEEISAQYLSVINSVIKRERSEASKVA